MKEYPSFSHLNNDQMKNLLQCMAICKSCSKMCAEDGHKSTAILCSECADVCDLTSRLLCMESQFASEILEFCNKVCKKCAEACEKMEADHCQECADVCKTCSESCTKTSSK